MIGALGGILAIDPLGASVHQEAHTDSSHWSDRDSPDGGDIRRSPTGAPSGDGKEKGVAGSRSSVGELIDEAARAYAYKVLPLAHHNSPEATPTRGRSSRNQDARLSEREARIRASIRADEDEDEDDSTTPIKGVHVSCFAELEQEKSADDLQDPSRLAAEDRKLARQFLREAR